MRPFPLPRHTLLLFVALLAESTTALAEESWLGTGRDGALTVTSTTVVNRAAPLAAAAPRGALTVEVARGVFFAGELLLLVQTQEEPPPDAGELAQIEKTDVGRFELARVGAIVSGGVQLEAPLRLAWPLGTQAVFVPEYESVFIADGGTLTGNAWDGRTGGVVAMLVRGALVNEGTISATGLGFRGGSWGAQGECVAAPMLPRTAGEGLWGQGRTVADYRDTGTGGQGGYCPVQERGAGGSNAGRGGFSGVALGGLPLVGHLGRLVLGGGGGAATGSTEFGPTAGGRGGGGVLVRAASLRSRGTVQASGVPSWGLGGAGAGGTVDVRAVEGLECGSVSAVGATPVKEHWDSPGAGGGGRVVLQGGSIDCAVDARAGVSAVRNSGPKNGAEAEYRGTVSVATSPFDPSVAPSEPAAALPSEEDAGPAIGTAPHRLTVGCGCGLAGSASAGAVAPVAVAGVLALLLRLHLRARRRHSRPEQEGRRVHHREPHPEHHGSTR
jgi:hypothetical protein